MAAECGDEELCGVSVDSDVGVRVGVPEDRSVRVFVGMGEVFGMAWHCADGGLDGCRIRPLYVFEKTVATFGTFALLYTVTESFIIPLTPSPEQSFWRSLLDLSIPFMVAYLLLFYIIFGELLCDAVTRFAECLMCCRVHM